MYRPILALLAGCVAVALAASNPNPFNVPEGFSLTAGKPTTLRWNPTTPGTVTLRLRQGASNNLDEGSVIQAGIPNSGSYTYTPDADAVRGSDYTIEIVSDSDPTATNYSPYFVLESSNTVASQSADSASASGTPSPSSSAAASTASASAAATTASAAASSTDSSAATSSGATSSAAASTGAASSGSASSGSASSSSALTGSASSAAASSAASSASSSSSFASRSAAARSTIAKASAAATSVAAGAAAGGQSSSVAMVGAVPDWKIQGGFFAVLLGAMAA